VGRLALFWSVGGVIECFTTICIEQVEPFFVTRERNSVTGVDVKTRIGLQLEFSISRPTVQQQRDIYQSEPNSEV